MLSELKDTDKFTTYAHWVVGLASSILTENTNIETFARNYHNFRLFEITPSTKITIKDNTMAWKNLNQRSLAE